MAKVLDSEERYKRYVGTRQKRFFSLYVGIVIGCGGALFLVKHEAISNTTGLKDIVVVIVSSAAIITAAGFLINSYLRFAPIPYMRFYDDASRLLETRLARDINTRFRTEDWGTQEEPVFSSELDVLKELTLNKQIYEIKYGHCFDNLYELEKKLRREIERITQNANLNLIIGILTTLVALGFLSYTVYQQHAFNSNLDFISHYVPRISLVVFIEIFSFFFLKLYRSNLDDIKFYQNEITNIDSKTSALKTAIFHGYRDDLSNILRSLVETERNMVLKKGESTVDIERMKVKSAESAATVNAVGKLVEKIKVQDLFKS